MNNKIQNNIIKLYSYLVYLGFRTGCHQRPDRSFHFQGYQFPVCARCTGVIIGYLLSVPLYVTLGKHLKLYLLFCLLMFLDWLAQYLNIMESTNIRRFITGVFGGHGVMGIQLIILTELIELLRIIC